MGGCGASCLLGSGGAARRPAACFEAVGSAVGCPSCPSCIDLHVRPSHARLYTPALPPCRSRRGCMHNMPRTSRLCVATSAVPPLPGCGSACLHRAGLWRTLPTSASSRWVREGMEHCRGACPPARLLACPLACAGCWVLAVLLFIPPSLLTKASPDPSLTTDDRRSCSVRSLAAGCPGGPAHPTPGFAQGAAAATATGGHVQHVRRGDTKGGAMGSGSAGCGSVVVGRRVGERGMYHHMCL